MAQKKFSDLTKVAEIRKADLLALEQADGTKQATFKQLCAAIAVQEIAEQVEDLPEIVEEDTLNVIAGKINKSKADMLEKINESNNIISDAFSEEKSYSAGDYAIYKDALYRFTADKTAGAWDPETVSPVTVAGMMSELNGNFSVKSAMRVSWTTGRGSALGLPDETGYYVLNRMAVYNTDGSIREGVEFAYGYYGDVNIYMQTWANSKVRDAWMALYQPNLSTNSITTGYSGEKEEL